MDRSAHFEQWGSTMVPSGVNESCTVDPTTSTQHDPGTNSEMGFPEVEADPSNHSHPPPPQAGEGKCRASQAAHGSGADGQHRPHVRPGEGPPSPEGNPARCRPSCPPHFNTTPTPANIQQVNPTRSQPLWIFTNRLQTPLSATTRPPVYRPPPSGCGLQMRGECDHPTGWGLVAWLVGRMYKKYPSIIEDNGWSSGAD